jgi:hypothetical protein
VRSQWCDVCNKYKPDVDYRPDPMHREHAKILICIHCHLSRTRWAATHKR